MKTYSTIIAGSRTVEHIELVERAIEASGFRITEVVSGCAAGADLFGEQWAKKQMIPIRRFPADWRKHGKAAGPIRNEEMARYADQLIAVWDGVSRGTADMIDRARRHGLAVYVYNYGERQTLNCPNCAHAHDISSRIAGDRIWCRCGQWLMLAFHQSGAAYFVKVQAPASYPREKRR